MIRCFIALGSNLEQPLQQVNDALTKLAALPDSRLIAASPWYQSRAVGPGQQPDYINGVAELHTLQPPLELLSLLQAIENQHQRKRLQHWGPRTLDLDLLLYGEETINHPRLTVPHPRMLERNFVLYPLNDLAPDIHFATGQSLKQLLNHCPMDGLRLVDAPTSPTIAGKTTP
ncbi:MAG: 2-amino-4-hydroxy-6-hydroxymethyldihydropteridine diphosphokinase [Spongiibacteraceae bacterium]